MICRAKTQFTHPHCRAPAACASWGYCRQRNLDAGGMSRVTPQVQAYWRKLDNVLKER